MTHAFRIHKTGGPEVLQWEEVAVSIPAAGEVRVRNHAVGLNFIDTYHRSGLYPVALPSGLGMEGAGVVEAIGPGVTLVHPGDRVAYCSGPLGSYAQVRLIPAERLIKLPAAIDFEQAAAMMLKGLTAQYLLRRTYALQAGETILVHAAAGGVGLIACQWAKSLGAQVIGTVSTEEKAALARSHGCNQVIVTSREPFTRRVKEITGGRGVAVVYDGVGKDTFEGSLDCLQPLGLMVSYGNASGPVPPFNILTLSAKGSLYLTRPTLATYTAKRDDLERMAAELFEVVTSGQVKIAIGQRYPLQDAAQAHRDLEARRTAGSSVLLP